MSENEDINKITTNLELVLNDKSNQIITNIDNKGKALIEQNNFFRDLTDIMNDDKFNKFFEKYFKTMEDIKTTVIYMKIFKLFENKYNELSNEELSKYVNVYLLHQIMTNSELRGSMISATIKHLEDNRKDILEIVNSDLKKKDIDI